MKEKIVLSGLLTWGLLILAACVNNPDAGAPDEPVVGDPAKGATQELPDDEVNLDGWLRGEVYIKQIDLVIMESYPIQVSLHVTGELPTPCDKLVYDVSAPDEDNQIQVDIYHLYDPAGICIQKIEPFDENIAISALDTPLEDGTYSVWVNGEKAGEFSYPGG